MTWDGHATWGTNSSRIFDRKRVEGVNTVRELQHDQAGHVGDWLGQHDQAEDVADWLREVDFGLECYIPRQILAHLAHRIAAENLEHRHV